MCQNNYILLLDLNIKIGNNPIITSKNNIMSFRTIIKDFTKAPISRNVILDLLKDYERPNDKISELIKNGELILLRRGLYAPGPALDLPQPEPFLIGNHLRGPSYISLECV